MFKDILDRLKSINPWHFLWITVLLSEIFTAVITSIQSYLRRGDISAELLRVGAIDSLFVPLVVAPIIIFFVARTKEIKQSNEQLQKEIAGRRKAEEELREEKTFTESALNVLQETFFVFDADGRFLRWNDTVKTVTGYDDEEISLMKPSDFFPEEERRRVAEAIATAMKTGHVRLETMILTKDGREIPFLFTGSLLKDREGRIVGISGTGTDVSEHRRAEALLQESEVKFRDMAERSMVGIYLIQDGIFRYVNSMLAGIFGYSVEELIDKKGPEDVVLPEDWPIVKGNLKRRISGEIESTHYRFRGIKKDRKTIRVEVYGSKTLYKAAPAVIGTLLDITERTQTEERISRQVQKLSALRSIDLAISASLDLRVTMKVFLEHVVSQLRVDAADVLLLNPRARTLKYAASQGFRMRASTRNNIRLGEGHAGIAALENRIVSIPNLKAEDNVSKQPGLLVGEDFVSYFGVPLVAKGHVKGVLEVFHRTLLEPDEEWLDFLDALALQAAIAIDNSLLFSDLERSGMDLRLAYDGTIEGWSRALDYRDKETEGHSRRVTDLTVEIAREMGMNEDELLHVRRGALLHDIGKMGVPDSILLKPGPLTEEEWGVMKRHPVYAYDLLHPIAYLKPAIDIPYCHHEKWDGTGYPRGLRRERIPLSARIFAAVDVWDALRSDRPYRPAWSDEKTRAHIRALSGAHFDPEVIDVFFRMQP
jgi:PAS domain S-box-containing protein/putative nucleotidyltransferase with HDIG domain